MSTKQNMACRALASAVILQALEDYQARSNSRDKTVQAALESDRRTASRFLLSDSARVFGFVWLCQMLDMDHERIRRSVDQPNLISELRRTRAAQDAYARERIS